MDTRVLIQTFTEFAKQKNVDRPTMIRILQDVFRAMIKKKFEHDDNFDIVINADKGDLEIIENKIYYHRSIFRQGFFKNKLISYDTDLNLINQGMME